MDIEVFINKELKKLRKERKSISPLFEMKEHPYYYTLLLHKNKGKWIAYKNILKQLNENKKNHMEK